MTFPEFATYWTRAIGASEDSLAQLSGGMNNNVYMCRSKEKKWVIKGYPQWNNVGRTDRMQAEVDFLRYTASVAPGFTPTLIEVDTLRRCTVLEHVSGKTYEEGVTPNKDEIQEAFCFYNKLNSDLELAKRLIRLDAGEGFLSLREHMDNVRARIAAMGTGHLPTKYKRQSEEILQHLRARSEKAAIILEDHISSGTVKDTIDINERCISPSDFGFHNAIRTRSRVVFIDFEFAGWDDPAKFCIDFTLQQRNPVNLRPIDVASILFPDKFRLMSRRLNVMREILLLKWFCIILGIFNPKNLSRAIRQDLNRDVSCELIISRQLMRYLEYCEIHSVS